MGVPMIFYSQVHSKQMAGADSTAHTKPYGFNLSSEWMCLQFVFSVALGVSVLFITLVLAEKFFCFVEEILGRLL